MNSLESIMNIMGNGNKLQSIKVNKSRAVYSNTLAKDLKRITHTNSFEGMMDLSEAFQSEIRGIENLMDYHIFHLGQTANCALHLHSNFSQEAAAYYVQSMEQTQGSNKNFFAKVWDGIKMICSKIVAFFMNLIKKIQYFLTKIFTGKYKRLYETFKAESFVNMEASIKVVPLPGDIASKMKKTAPDYQSTFLSAPVHKLIISGIHMPINKVKTFWNALIGNKEGVSKLIDEFDKLKKELHVPNIVGGNMSSIKAGKIKEAKDIEADINKHFFGSEKRPKKVKTTVEEYLNATAGEKPELLFVLSESSIKSFEEDVKHSKMLLKHQSQAHKELNAIESKKSKGALSKQEKEAFQDAIQISKYVIKQSNIAASCAYMVFMAKMAVCSNVYRAVKAGLKQPKKDKTKS